jgi:small subunit ribosomal protein S13
MDYFTMEKKETPKQKYIVRIASTDLDGSRPVFIALQKIKGIGNAMSSAICHIAKVPRHDMMGLLTDEQVKALDTTIRNPSAVPTWMYNWQNDVETGKDSHFISGDLTFAVDMSIKKMKMIKSYRGMRHAFGLPVRGQRTRSNHRKNKQKKAQAAKSRPTKKSAPVQKE